MKTITHKGFTIEAELGDDPKVDITISKTIDGKLYFGSIGAAEFEGLSNDGGETIRVPVSVIDRAYEVEESLLS